MSVTITGAKELYKKIDKLVKWSEKDSKALQNVGHKVGAVYANFIKSNVKDLGKDIFVRGTKVKSGQLRRSGGTWQPDKNRNTIMGGPRTNAVGRRKTKKADDGWYAHIVEKGDFGPRFGGKHKTQNTGVFARGIKATKSRSIKLQEILLKKNFAKYTNRL
mgnify:FL=1